jgi:methyltransferase (TIGR00027 family)
MQELVRNVSDTARWVATYRALETARKDPLFDDPWADRLAGERGRAIAAVANRHAAWSLVTRTKLIDDMVMSSVAQGTRRVLNLAAGFDTRPYRLPLTKDVTWVEADLPALIAEKEQLLAGEAPRCTLERHAIDLAEDGARRGFLASQGQGPTLVLTEGLVIYLQASVVETLGRDLAAVSGITGWILDFSSPRIMTEMQQGMRRLLKDAPFLFAPANGVGFFERLGWRAREVRSMLVEAARFRRLPLWMRPFALLPQPDPRNLKDARWSAVVWLSAG